MTDFNEIKRELAELKAEKEAEENSNVIKKTLKKLLDIERKSIYGEVRGKSEQLEKVVVSSLKDYKKLKLELSNAAEKS